MSTRTSFHEELESQALEEYLDLEQMNMCFNFNCLAKKQLFLEDLKSAHSIPWPGTAVENAKPNIGQFIARLVKNCYSSILISFLYKHTSSYYNCVVHPFLSVLNNSLVYFCDRIWICIVLYWSTDPPHVAQLSFWGWPVNVLWCGC